MQCSRSDTSSAASNQIDQPLARKSVGRSGAARAPVDGDLIQGTAALPLRLRPGLPSGADGIQGRNRGGGRRNLRNARYNRSIPGALKNGIDWASRPYGTNAFTRKPSAVIGTSPGKIGTAVAQQHLRSILAFCNSPLMNSIEAYIQFEDGLINEDGSVSDESTREFLKNYMAEFHGFITRVYTALPRSR